MPHHNSKNKQVSTAELLEIVSNQKKFNLKNSDIYKFYKSYNIKSGTKFYSTDFLLYLYTKKEYEPITKHKFVRGLKQLATYKRKNTIRGFLLNDLKEDILDIYNHVNEKKEKKTIGRIIED